MIVIRLLIMLAPCRLVSNDIGGENQHDKDREKLHRATILSRSAQGQEDDGFPKRPQVLSLFFIPSSLISPINNKSRFTEPLTGEPYTINPEKPTF
jgi:hypothetical protein